MMIYPYLGVSENRENPIYPMVLLIIIPFLNGYFIGNINPTFSDKPILSCWRHDARSGSSALYPTVHPSHDG